MNKATSILFLIAVIALVAGVSIFLPSYLAPPEKEPSQTADREEEVPQPLLPILSADSEANGLVARVPETTATPNEDALVAPFLDLLTKEDFASAHKILERGGLSAVAPETRVRLTGLLSKAENQSRLLEQARKEKMVAAEAAKKAKAEVEAARVLQEVSQKPPEQVQQPVTGQYAEEPPSTVPVTKVIYFKVGSDFVRASELQVLREVIAFLGVGRGRRAELVGYADPSGSEEANRKLAKSRCGKVIDKLIEMGVSPGALLVNKTGILEGADVSKDAREDARRVEITLVKERS